MNCSPFPVLCVVAVTIPNKLFAFGIADNHACIVAKSFIKTNIR